MNKLEKILKVLNSLGIGEDDYVISEDSMIVSPKNWTSQKLKMVLSPLLGTVDDIIIVDVDELIINNIDVGDFGVEEIGESKKSEFSEISEDGEIIAGVDDLGEVPDDALDVITDDCEDEECENLSEGYNMEEILERLGGFGETEFDGVVAVTKLKEQKLSNIIEITSFLESEGVTYEIDEDSKLIYASLDDTKLEENLKFYELESKILEGFKNIEENITNKLKENKESIKENGYFIKKSDAKKIEEEFIKEFTKGKYIIEESQLPIIEKQLIKEYSKDKLIIEKSDAKKIEEEFLKEMSKDKFIVEKSDLEKIEKEFLEKLGETHYIISKNEVGKIEEEFIRTYKRNKKRFKEMLEKKDEDLKIEEKNLFSDDIQNIENIKENESKDKAGTSFVESLILDNDSSAKNENVENIEESLVNKLI